jgi:hypothetical protein
MVTKLSVEKFPTKPAKMENMDYIPYASVVGNLLYVICYTVPNISQVVGVLI